MAYKPGTKVQSSIFLDVEQHKKLSKLSDKTRVPMQAYLREAVDLLLKKYQREMGK